MACVANVLEGRTLGSWNSDWELTQGRKIGREPLSNHTDDSGFFTPKIEMATGFLVQVVQEGRGKPPLRQL